MSGLIAAEGDHPSCTEPQRRKDGDTDAITKRGRAAAPTARPLRQGAGTGPHSGLVIEGENETTALQCICLLDQRTIDSAVDEGAVEICGKGSVSW